MILRTDHLVIEHKAGKPVLQDVSAVFAAGEVTAVLGPNGAGKSTLLRCLAGLVDSPALTRGQVLLDGAEIASVSRGVLASKLAFIPQREEIPVGFTVEEVVAMGAEAGGGVAGGGERVQVGPALERLGLAGLRERRVETLSEGQRQRVTMARAYAQTRGMIERPGVVLADEPAAALDPALAAEAMSVFRELARRGRTVVVVLHDADLALRWADQALLLRQDGTVLEQGPAATTLTPANLETLFGVRWAVVRVPSSAAAPGGRDAVIPV